MSNACETHVHGEYVTFPSSGIYHLSESDLEHTRCGLLLFHPYHLKNGLIVDAFEGGVPFPSFHQPIPEGRRLCLHCQKREEQAT